MYIKFIWLFLTKLLNLFILYGKIVIRKIDWRYQKLNTKQINILFKEYINNANILKNNKKLSYEAIRDITNRQLELNKILGL